LSVIELKQHLNLSDIMNVIVDESYCIIKLPNEYPLYKEGSDLDIFCYNLQVFSKLILGELQKKIDKTLQIKVTENNYQLYIDIIKDGQIHFRFDLYGKLPIYKNVNIKSALFSSVIENSRTISRDDSQVKVPSIIDETILRYIEYQEWYASRPDKIKHVEYILNKIEINEIDKNKMFDKLHYYTSLPLTRSKKPTSLSDKSYLYTNIKKTINHIKSNGIKKTLYKIKFKVLK